MIRALVAVCVALALWFVPGIARAFHSGNVFDKAPGAGGGGGIFYSGAARDRGWDCRACHVGAEGKIRVGVESDPPSLLETLRYEPGRAYALKVTLLGEHRGLASPRANFNSVVVDVENDDGTAGTIDGFAPDDLFSGGAATVVTAGTQTARTVWSMRWTAPPRGTGKLTLRIAAVDGDGAGSDANGTLTDPFGDDVFVGALDLEEDQGATMRNSIGTIGLALAMAAASCGTDAVKEDPCPRGICTGTGGGGADSGTSAEGGGGCAESWTCTPWAKNPQGTYGRVCTDANKCGTSSGKPQEGPVSLPDLDVDHYQCKVEPIVDRGCAMLGCHGTESGRAYKVYARGRLRRAETVPPLQGCLRTQPQKLDEKGTGTVMCEGWLPHTAGEWQENYDNARAFMVGLTNPDDSDLLAQPVYGGKAHAGVHLFAKTDADYQTIRAWLGGAKLGSKCDPLPN